MPPRRRVPPASVSPAAPPGTVAHRRAPAPTLETGEEWDPRKVVIPRPGLEHPFELVSNFTPAGGQPAAIDALVAGVEAGEAAQVLLGITGSGKTFTIANVIARTQRPTIILAHNKTLAAQLYAEFKALFPHNAVEYFVSYYDYYQPEAYVPSTDTFIEKDSNINEQLDRMRHSATYSLLSRRDVIIVSSVSCIYGIGAAEAYLGMVAQIAVGEELDRDKLLRKLVEMQYERNDIDFHRGCFRVRGDVVEVFPAYEDDTAIRIEFFGDEVEAIREIDPLRGQPKASVDFMNGIRAQLPTLSVPVTWLKATPGVVPSDDYPPSLRKLVELKGLLPRMRVKSFGPGHHFLAEENPARVVELVVETIGESVSAPMRSGGAATVNGSPP